MDQLEAIKKGLRKQNEDFEDKMSKSSQLNLSDAEILAILLYINVD